MIIGFYDYNNHMLRLNEKNTMNDHNTQTIDHCPLSPFNGYVSQMNYRIYYTQYNEREAYNLQNCLKSKSF